jgi:hypothetical protein
VTAHVGAQVEPVVRPLGGGEYEVGFIVGTIW